MAEQCGSDEVHANAADELRCPRPRELFGDDVVLDRAATATAVLLGPSHTDEPTARELRLPRSTERHLFSEFVEAGRQALAVLPWEIGAQPLAHFVAQSCFLGSRAEVHARRKLAQAPGGLGNVGYDR